ncbi:hypothetical protein EV189_1665 [Motilibacter rhizosphaerae]|uniref:Uncharacterized protein n=1 Tax=Motilibacter rhizosphaerae TaxID=598652 RepID=A0A4Q7NSX6_9ACTN|nr:hypothetical protein [Motilibacter rhizosphaerae]RZS89888.1 hypothetical protein EV189_1665 [Motilibacter rhizosphaerae]
MTTPALQAGQLPPGRWVADLVAVEATYVPSNPADVRRQIWEEWRRLTLVLQSVVGSIPACWLSGSFFTDKAVPGDLDCLYIVDVERLKAVTTRGDPGETNFISIVAANAVKQVFSLRVDSFILEWSPYAGPLPPGTSRQYHEDRGYWDNLWVRVKDQDKRLDSVPRRGYLEVIIDGYR